MSFSILDYSTRIQVVDMLEKQDITNMALTCRDFLHAVQDQRRLGFAHDVSRSVTGPLASTNTVTWAPTVSPSASLPSSVAADYDALANTDTDVPSSPEEDEWEFEITPEIIRRLSLLPVRQSTANIEGLPTELKLEIFSYLDQIDSTCLGLTSPDMYIVHRAIHGTKIPLNTRRVGPNSLESAWEVVGKQECKQCKMYRCELHEHIKTWMPQGLEYCSMKKNFGLRAKENSTHQSCFRGKPSKPHRCGRHPLRTTSVHQDDSSFSIPH
ncbi:hypothetical protein WAI453_000205 [Rhynchosporium graminicola]|uniref:F-box domain-containing protein n=1 Tax=Rhynchosporium graminicola TaxID=2792576 RepID=A0A1E1K372_9HELO|nr:uncharacterized protein RCO7_00812 [Rhynchosporium commune]